MKNIKEKIGLFKKIKKASKGFTLVELLAVIVILAIIMIIAIPSVLSTLSTARRKSFEEYVTKAYTGAQKEYMTDTMMGVTSQCYLYDIKNLFDSTGEFNGYVLISRDGNDAKYYITLWNTNYMIYGFDYDQIDSIELLNFTSDTDANLSIANLVAVGKCSGNYVEGGEEKIATGGSGTSSSGTAAATDVKYTGYLLSSNGGWYAHYTEGTMDKCYTSNAFVYDTLSDEYECTTYDGKNSASNVCCTTPKDEYINSSDFGIPYYSFSLLSSTGGGLKASNQLATHFTGSKVSDNRNWIGYYDNGNIYACFANISGKYHVNYPCPGGTECCTATGSLTAANTIYSIGTGGGLPSYIA